MPANPQRWSEITELGFVSGMRLLFWLYRHLGSWALNLVLQPVVLYYLLTNRRARQASTDYLQHLQAFDPTGSSPAPGWRSSYRHLLAFARATVDKLGVWANADVLERVSFPNRPLLLRQLDSGRGAILLGAHLGNMEICRSLSRLNHRLKLNILVHTGHADMFNRLLRELQLHCELELIEVSELSPATAIRLADCIERGEFIAILADRVPVASGATRPSRSRLAAFLGQPAAFPEGPFILASLLKCPVYTVFCTRTRDGRTHDGYRIDCQLFSERIQLPRKTRGAALDKYIRRYAAQLEQQLQQAPLQWFNFYPFWDQPL